jgi:hypothetical protein
MQRNHPTTPKTHQHPEFAEESPELLRWRADMLLDEMMLGAVDVSAGEPGENGTAHPSPPYAADHAAEANGAAEHATHNGNGAHHPGSAAEPTPWMAHEFSRSEPPAERIWMETSYADAPESAAEYPAHGDQQSAAQDPHGQSDLRRDQAAPTAPQPADNRHGQRPADPTAASHFVAAPFPSARPSAPSAHPHAPQDEALYQAAEDDATQDDLLRPPSAVDPYRGGSNETAATGPAQPTSGPATGANEQRTPRPDHLINNYVANQAHQREQERRQWSIMTGRANDYPTSVPRSAGQFDSAAQRPYETVDAANGRYAGEAHAYEAGAGAYQNQSMPFADSMAVGPQAQRRSNMLPRQSAPDMDALQQEIFSLQERVETALPIGQDTLERARHLIEKAYGLLPFGPDRAAEISYYTQQVRSILQRAEQRLYWSNVYRKRLTIYLVGWLLLSTILLVSGYLYPAELRTLLARVTGLSVSGPVAQHFVPFLLTVSAGALGSALGALVNMWRHSQKEYGFFDRKYGLLGLVLPLIGTVVGVLLYLVVGAIYFFFNLNPASAWIYGTAPALLALLFGCSQEKIYGTSD